MMLVIKNLLSFLFCALHMGAGLILTKAVYTSEHGQKALRHILAFCPRQFGKGFTPHRAQNESYLLRPELFPSEITSLLCLYYRISHLDERFDIASDSLPVARHHVVKPFGYLRLCHRVIPVRIRFQNLQHVQNQIFFAAQNLVLRFNYNNVLVPKIARNVFLRKINFRTAICRLIYINFRRMNFRHSFHMPFDVY